MIGEFLEYLGISFGFPFFDFQPLKAWHSLHLGTERYMTKPGGATFSCMRPPRAAIRPKTDQKALQSIQIITAFGLGQIKFSPTKRGGGGGERFSPC